MQRQRPLQAFLSRLSVRKAPASLLVMARSRHVLWALLGWLAAGCTEPEPPPNVVEAPVEGGLYQTPGPPLVLPWKAADMSNRCPAVDSSKVSPAEFEGPMFVLRYPRDATAFMAQPDFACLQHRYSASAIDAWASQGDPLASYLQLLRTYGSWEAVCSNQAEIERRLMLVRERRVHLETVGREVVRFPEASMVISQVRRGCGGDAQAAESQSSADGYRPLLETMIL